MRTIKILLFALFGMTTNVAAHGPLQSMSIESFSVSDSETVYNTVYVWNNVYVSVSGYTLLWGNVVGGSFVVNHCEYVYQIYGTRSTNSPHTISAHFHDTKGHDEWESDLYATFLDHSWQWNVEKLPGGSFSYSATTDSVSGIFIDAVAQAPTRTCPSSTLPPPT